MSPIPIWTELNMVGTGGGAVLMGGVVESGGSPVIVWDIPDVPPSVIVKCDAPLGTITPCDAPAPTWTEENFT